MGRFLHSHLDVIANNQITGSFEFPKLLERIREKALDREVNFEDLLREHGLEEYCEALVEEEEGIPF